MIFFTISLALTTSLALAQRQPQAPQGYAPAPEAHQPFQYQYGVADAVSKSNFQKSETQDGSVSVHNSDLSYHVKDDIWMQSQSVMPFFKLFYL